MTALPNALPNADDVLMGGGARGAEWPAIGARVDGVIAGQPRTYHCREYAPNGQGPLRFFADGGPVVGVKIDLQTGIRVDADDDGIRRIYCEKPRMMSAIRQAVRLSGAAGLEPGAWLSVTWTGTEASQSGQPANTYAAEYRRPSTPIPAATPKGAPAQALHRAQAHQRAQRGEQADMLPPPQAAQAQTYTAPVQPEPQSFPYGGGPHVPAAQAPVQPVLPAPTQAAPVSGRVITETLAAAMRNAGVDVSGFTVIPG